MIPLIAWRTATVGLNHEGGGPKNYVRIRNPVDRLRS
ncbi:hypothetical protein QFZ67_000445 [Streptomyces sp. V1I1]|nr:hypothetical protein [Streptomyces sp. V1I1]